MSSLCAACIFCQIIKKEVPSKILLETEKTLAFLDIFPLSRGHVLVIPKYHAAKFHQIPDPHLDDILLVSKRLVNACIKATGVEDYNILQNNGSMAHQEVQHVHFHLIPKPNQSEGLGITWPQKKADDGELTELASQIKNGLNC